MTVRDIRDHLAELYDVEVSRARLPRRAGLQGPRRGGDPQQGAHVVLGVDADSRKEVLGIWIETNEGARFWLRVCNQLRNRGVEDVLVVVCDGLKRRLPARPGHSLTGVVGQDWSRLVTRVMATAGMPVPKT